MTRKAFNPAASTLDAQHSSLATHNAPPLTVYAVIDELQWCSCEPIAYSRQHIVQSIAIRERAALVQQTSQALVERAKKLSEYAMENTG